MINLAIASLLVLTAGGQTPSTTTVNSAATVQQSARANSGLNGAQRVCVREEAQLTGSILPRTICRTRDEWQRAGGLPVANHR
jgi:hypothetical protein